MSSGRGRSPRVCADERGVIRIALTSRVRPRSQAAHMDFSGVSDTCVSTSCKYRCRCTSPSYRRHAPRAVGGLGPRSTALQLLATPQSTNLSCPLVLSIDPAPSSPAHSDSHAPRPRPVGGVQSATLLTHLKEFVISREAHGTRRESEGCLPSRRVTLHGQWFGCPWLPGQAGI